tara:strand:+ start:325 stop:1161 length:837 start_codon:yes stop_codon:yes gene_type:complete
MENKEAGYEKQLGDSSLEDFDYAVFNWLNETLDLHAKTNKGWKKVPVIWVAGEKVHQAKKNPDLRDSSGALILPLTTVERTGVAKDPTRRGTAAANVPNNNDNKGGALTIAKRIKQDKTATFANAAAAKKPPINFRTAKNDRVVYEVINIPNPVYIEATYVVILRTEYQEQMNNLIQPFMTRTGGPNHTIIKHNKHRYEAFIGQDFSFENTVSDIGDGERNYITTIEIKVLGALIGDGPNQEKPKRAIRETIVDVKLMRERVMMGDEAQFAEDKKYRE